MTTYLCYNYEENMKREYINYNDINDDLHKTNDRQDFFEINMIIQI